MGMQSCAFFTSTMKPRYLVIIAIIFIHLGMITTKMFRDAEPFKTILETIPPLRTIAEVYTQATVMQADYSFFSPNIAPDTILDITVTDTLGQVHKPNFRLPNNEIKVRFHSQLLGFRQVDNSAQDLIARSWAARVYDQFPTARYINLTGYDYHLPRQWEWAAGKRPTKERFFEIQFQTAE